MTVKRSTLATGAALLALGGCGVTTQGAIDELGTAAGGPATAESKPASQSNAGAVAGRVVLDGTEQTTLVPRLLEAYRSGGGATDVVRRTSGEESAFAALCAGEIDAVDSLRPISAEELAACRAEGLEPVQVQVAAEAVVLAAKAETDFGADCVDLSQVKELFRAGSPIYEWSQLGFDAVPAQVGGPPVQTRTFRVFARQALGTTNPGTADVRSDYEISGTDTAARRWVTGDAADVPLAAQRERLGGEAERTAAQLAKAKESRIAAQRERTAARADQRKGKADDRSAAQQARAAARVRRADAGAAAAEAYVRRAQVAADRAAAAVSRSRAAAKRTTELQGRVGLFRFGYYELYEEQLRPLEISAERGERRSCVFPSQDSIIGGTYPLSQPMLLTTTTARLERSELQSVLAATLRRAPQVAEAAGFTPLPDATVRLQLRWVDGSEQPAVVTAKQPSPAQP